MDHVKSVNLVFEAYEDLEFEAEELRIFCCEDIKSKICRVARNSIVKQTFCKRMYLELDSSVNTEFEEGRTVFDRLKTPDLIAVVITYEDGSTEYIYVPWGGEDGFSNQYQTSYMTSSGSLRLLVDSEQQAKEFFEEE